MPFEFSAFSNNFSTTIKSQYNWMEHAGVGDAQNQSTEPFWAQNLRHVNTHLSQIWVWLW